MTCARCGQSLEPQTGKRPAWPGSLDFSPGVRLTARELEVARLVAQGLANKEIAAALRISPGTVKLHIKHSLFKVGLENRVQLALWWVWRELRAPAA